MHAGAEGADADRVTDREEYYLGEDRGDAEAFAHMAIDAGASLVIASGPHVMRGMQFYQGRLIAYSLGNFAGYGNFGTSGDLDLGAVLHVTLSSAGPVRARPDLPHPVHHAGSARARRRGRPLHRPALRRGFRPVRGPHPAVRRHPGTVTSVRACRSPTAPRPGRRGVIRSGRRPRPDPAPAR